MIRKNLLQEARRNVFEASRQSATNRQQTELLKRYGVTDENKTRNKIGEVLEGDQSKKEKSA